MKIYSYHYNFSETGVPEIDNILRAVACAGSCYHDTANWQDETLPTSSFEGNCPQEWIQNAANVAANKLSKKDREEKESECVHYACPDPLPLKNNFKELK